MISTVKTFHAKDDQFLQMLGLYRDQIFLRKIGAALLRPCKSLRGYRDFAAAFRYYSEGNGLRKEQLKYDQSGDEELSTVKNTQYALQNITAT